MAGLRRDEQRPVAVGRSLQDLIQQETRVVVIVVPFGLGALDGLLDQEDRDEERQDNDDS